LVALSGEVPIETAAADWEEIMKCVPRWLHALAVGLLGISLTWTSASAQQSSVVGGLIVNFGIVPAEVALGVAGHRESHPAHPPSGSQHLLITLDDEKSGKRVGDAEVVIEVTDPHGRVEKKPLLHTQAGGLPDYSELFTFGWSGEYSIHVIITARPGAKPLETRFVVNHLV
jgi:hypothetical protein